MVLFLKFGSQNDVYCGILAEQLRFTIDILRRDSKLNTIQIHSFRYISVHPTFIQRVHHSIKINKTMITICLFNFDNIVNNFSRRDCKCLWMPTLFAFSSVMASVALTRDRILHYLSRQVKFYSLSFHVTDIKRLFQRNKLLYFFERCSFTEYVG